MIDEPMLEEETEEEVSPERRKVAKRLLFTVAILSILMAGLLAVEIIEHFFVR